MSEPVIITSVDPTLYENEAVLTKLTVSGASTDSDFGQSIAYSADGLTVAIGAPLDNNAVGDGAVFIFAYVDRAWVQQVKLLPPVNHGATYFGKRVAISADGNHVAVGAYGEDRFSGAVYIFLRTNNIWAQQKRIVSPTPANNSRFGAAISLSEDGAVLVVGAPRYLNNVGAIYVYDRTAAAWAFTKKLTASDGARGHRFGRSVSISADGKTLLAGAFGNASQAGAAYTFVNGVTGWVAQTKLMASDHAVKDRFGYSVALSADGLTALVGAYAASGLRGAVYVYKYAAAAWTQQAKLVADDAAVGDRFGRSLAITIDGNVALIGISLDDNAKGVDAGAVYIFTRTVATWAQSAKLVASDSTKNDQFGQAVAISQTGDKALIGSRFDTEGANGAVTTTGAVYQAVWTEPAGI